MSCNLNHVKMVKYQPTGTVQRLMAEKILVFSLFFLLLLLLLL